MWFGNHHVDDVDARREPIATGGFDAADDPREVMVRRRIRVVSVIVALASVIAAGVATWGVPDSAIDDGSGTVVIDGVRVSRALGITTPEELRKRSSQKFTSYAFGDPTQPCVSYSCMVFIEPGDADEAFETGDTACRPYLQWACAADDYHRATTRTAW